MRRTALTILLAGLVLGLAAGPTQAAKAKKLESKVEIESYYTRATFSFFFGDVHAKKNKCERNRSVTIRNVGPGGPGVAETVGTATTDETGDYQVGREVFDLDGGPYVAEVERKRIGKKGKKLVCKRATSEPIEYEL